MKKITVLLFVIISLHAFSQSDPKAKSVLDKVSEKTRNYPSITATFDFNIQNNEAGINETSKGSLILQKDKYKLSFNGVDIFCDGKTQWTYMPDAKEVSINNADNGEENAINPVTIFTIYEKGFKNSYLGEFTNEGKKTCKVELIPLVIKDFTRLIIEIDLSTYQIVSAKMFGTDGNEYNIRIKTMVTTNNYETSTFAFDIKKNPKVEVVDMR
jgi:outer membrane lipoprotein-sorting protein